MHCRITSYNVCYTKLLRLDTETRQRTVIITVPDPLILPPPLLANTFVTVSFPGRPTGNLLQLPGSALSQRGEIWYVTSDNVITSYSIHYTKLYEPVTIFPERVTGSADRAAPARAISSRNAGSSSGPEASPARKPARSYNFV